MQRVEITDPLGVPQFVGNHDQKPSKVKHQTATATLDPWSQIAIMFISTLSFIAAFAWNEMVTSFLDQRYGKSRNFRIHLLYAVVVTVVAAIAIYFIARYTDIWITKQQEEQDIVV